MKATHGDRPGRREVRAASLRMRQRLHGARSEAGAARCAYSHDDPVARRLERLEPLEAQVFGDSASGSALRPRDTLLEPKARAAACR